MKWWNNLSLKAKFLTGVGSLFLLTALNAALFVTTLQSLLNDQEELSLASEVKDALDFREIQHLQWVSALSSYLLSDSLEELTISKDPTECGLGKWYYSDARTDAIKAIPGIAKPLDNIRDPHGRFHATAQQIEDLVIGNNREEAIKIFQAQTLPALLEVQAVFAEVRKQLNNNVELQKTMFNEVSSKAQTQSIILSLIVFVAIILFTIILFKSILHPIILISEFSRRCREDGKQCQIKTDLNLDREDELGQLARNLSEMVDHLQKELAFSRGVLNGIAVPCAVFSSDNKTLFTNQLMIDLIELVGTPEDYLGQTSGEYIWGDKTRETLSSKALKQNKLLAADIDFKTVKGNIKHINITSTPIYDQSGKSLGTLANWIDLTDVINQKNAIEESSKKIAEVAVSVIDVAATLSTSSEELAAQIEQSSTGAIMQRDHVTETATAMTEMNSTVVEVARSATEASSTASDAKAKAEDGNNVVRNLLNSIAQVDEYTCGVKDGMDRLVIQAEDVGSIIGVINDIADQTNLLALNAAIEAARAGDAGRGFAVVADEVRKLAEKTMQATSQVGQVITGIQNGTQSSMQNVEKTTGAVKEAHDLSEEAGKSLNEIVGMVDNVASQIHSIATASEEQSASSNEINQSLENVSRISDETSTAMREAAEAVEILARQASDLSTLVVRLQA